MPHKHYPINDDDLELVSCPLCQSESHTFLIESSGRSENLATRSVDGLFKIVQCNNCSFVFTNPRPKLSWSLQRYETPMPGDRSRHHSPLHHHLEAIASIGPGLKIINKAVDSGKILDVGSGAGLFLACAQLMGYDTEGVEISEVNVEASRKILPDTTFHLGDLLDLNLPSESFDVITMWNVIEHLRNPIEVLSECHRLLKPGGVIYLETPNASLPILRAKKRWLKFAGKPVFMIPYEHISFFTPGSLEFALTASGFRSAAEHQNGWQTIFEHGRFIMEDPQKSYAVERIKRHIFRFLFLLSFKKISIMPCMTVVGTK